MAKRAAKVAEDRMETLNQISDKDRQTHQIWYQHQTRQVSCRGVWGSRRQPLLAGMALRYLDTG